MADTLRRKTTNTEKLRIATFGNQKQEVQAVNLVELALSKPETGFKLPLNGFSVPHIWSELQGQDLSWVKENYPRSSMAVRKGGEEPVEGGPGGCLNNCCLGTVRPCEKLSQREMVEHTVFTDSCVES